MDVKEFLEIMVREGERKLGKLVGRADAWRTLDVIFHGPFLPGPARGLEAREVLGEEWRVVENGRKGKIVEQRKPWRVAEVTAIAAAALAEGLTAEIAFAAGRAWEHYEAAEAFPEIRRVGARDALTRLKPEIETGTKMRKATERARTSKDEIACERARPWIKKVKEYRRRHPKCSQRQLARWLEDGGFPGDARHFVRHATAKQWV